MGSTAPTPEVITYDYQFAPNAQKGRNLLTACGVPYISVEQPFVQPRPILTDLGITYRRIPVNFIGKDGYCDNRVFVEAVQNIFKDQALPTTPADHAYESFGYRSFWVCLPLVPVKLLSKELQTDRANLFKVFSRPDFGDLRQSALAEFRHMLDIVEHDFLRNGRFINGDDHIGVADIHAGWMLKWALQTIDVGSEAGFSKSDFPKVWNWIEALPVHDAQGDSDKLEALDARQRILNSVHAAADIGVDETDPTGLRSGDEVTVSPNDDDVPENTQQKGKLVGLSRRETVIQLENDIRLHFPRIGYVVKKA